MENYLTLKFEFEKRNIEEQAALQRRQQQQALLAFCECASVTQRQDASWSLCIQCKEKGGDGRGRVRVRHKGIVTKSK